MPYKFETQKQTIPRDLKKNTKISLQDRELIKEDYKNLKSQRKTALKWNISRRLVQFITDPEKEQRNKELFTQKQKTGIYYDKQKHTKAVNKYRHYKKQLSIKGVLEVNKLTQLH